MALVNYNKKDLIRFADGTYFLVTPVWEDPEWVKNNPKSKTYIGNAYINTETEECKEKKHDKL